MKDDVEILIDKYGYWGEHPDHSVDTWMNEVSGWDTRLGYWEWVEARESDGEEK